jgi:hypothetical protein
MVAWVFAAAVCLAGSVLGLAMLHGTRAPRAARTDGSAPGATASNAPAPRRPARRGEMPVVAASPSSAPPTDARAVSLQGRGQLVLASHAVASLPAELGTTSRGAVEVRLERGRIDATVSPRAPDEPFSIVTAQVSVTVVGTAFSVDVDDGVTTVAVFHGRVRVQSAEATVFVGAGESIRSDDARFGKRRMTSPTPDGACGAGEPDAQKLCLTRAATRGGLDGENALLSLGLLERDKFGDHAAALSRFQEYARRYPRGALAPEVALATARTFSSDGAGDAACDVCDNYARRFPADQQTLQRLQAFCRR